MSPRVTAILGLAVLLAGCGDDGGASTTSATEAPTTTQAPVATQAPTTTVAPATTTTTQAPTTTTWAPPPDAGLAWARVGDPAVFGGPGDQFVYSVAAGGPGVVAVGMDASGDDGDGAVWVSADGYTWSRIPHDEAVFGGAGDQWIFSVVAGGPGLVAAGGEASDGDEDAVVWVSADGYAWSRIDDEAAFGGPGGQGIESVALGGAGPGRRRLRVHRR